MLGLHSRALDDAGDMLSVLRDDRQGRASAAAACAQAHLWLLLCMLRTQSLLLQREHGVDAGASDKL